MDVQSYCDNLQRRLIACRTAIYESIRQLDEMTNGDRGKTICMILDLYDLVDELSIRIGQIEKAYVTEWDL